MYRVFRRAGGVPNELGLGARRIGNRGFHICCFLTRPTFKIQQGRRPLYYKPWDSWSSVTLSLDLINSLFLPYPNHESNTGSKTVSWMELSWFEPPLGLQLFRFLLTIMLTGFIHPQYVLIWISQVICSICHSRVNKSTKPKLCLRRKSNWPEKFSSCMIYSLISNGLWI